MAYDGHLSFDTKLDSSGFSAGVSKLGNIAKGGLSILGGAVAGVTGVMAAGMTMGMKYNADMEMYMSNFEVMLGSAEAAADFVNKLKETSAATPFEMSDLADSAKTLLAFGSTAESANDQIKMLGDISLGNSQKLQTLSTAFGRIQSNGKASMEEINMMIDSGFNPLNIIAAKTGESMDSLRKRVSAGGVSFEEINDAMVQATSAGGQFYQGMEKASTTMQGLISTLKDNAMSLLGEVVQPISEQMTSTLLPAAIDAVDQLSQAFEEGGTEQLIQVGAGIIANIATGIAEQLPSIVETAISFLTTLVDSLNQNVPQLVQAGGQLLLALASGILQLIPSLLQLGITIVASIVQGLVSSIGSLVSSGQDSIGSYVDGMLSKLPDVIAAGGEALNRLIDKLLSGLPQMLSSGVQLLGQVAQGILNNLPAILAAIASVLAQLIATIVSHLPEFLQKGIELLGQVAAGLIQAIPKLLSTIPEIFSAVKTKFSELDWLQIGKDIVKGIANGLKSAIETIVSAAKSVGEAALNGLKGLLGIHSPSRVFRDEVGKNIALGIADGIRGNKEYAQKSAEEIGQATLDAAQKKLDNWKVYNDLTAADEAAFWDEIRKQTAEGTQARIDADEKYFKAKQSLNQDMQDAEEKYTDNVAKAYENLNDKIKELNEQYKNAVDSRTNEIKNAYGLFDEFDNDTDLTSDDLLNNLQSQVDGLRQWEKNLDDLADRGVGDDLIAELQDLGPKSAAEVQLLTEMTDEQLDDYVSLFRTKNRLARKQAVEELEPMQQDIANQISQLKVQTQQELAQYQQEYMDAMAQLGVALDKPAEDMKLLMAQNAVEMVATLASSVKDASGSTENTEKFKAIADNVLNASANLPQSMTELGQNAIMGMIQGIQSKAGALASAMSFVVNSAVSQAISAAVSGNAIDEAINETTAEAENTPLPAQNYGNEGYGPGYQLDYTRMGAEMAMAMTGVRVNMDGKAVGNIVAEPVNNNLGTRGRKQERDTV